MTVNQEGFSELREIPLFAPGERSRLWQNRPPDNIITTQRNGQTIVAELFFNHSSTETFRDKLLKLVLADSTRLSASDGQEPEKTEILR
ncbi:MAG: transposon-encoded TnpW family protein [Subdoligranulum sp.]